MTERTGPPAGGAFVILLKLWHRDNEDVGVLDEHARRLAFETVVEAARGPLAVGWLPATDEDFLLHSEPWDTSSDRHSDLQTTLHKVLVLLGVGIPVDDVYRRSVLRLSSELAEHEARCIGLVLPPQQVTERLLQACTHIIWDMADDTGA